MALTEIINTAVSVAGFTIVVHRIAREVKRLGGWKSARQTGAFWFLGLSIASFAIVIYVSTLPPWLPREFRVPIGLAGFVGLGGGLLAFMKRLQAHGSGERAIDAPLA